MTGQHRETHDEWPVCSRGTIGQLYRPRASRRERRAVVRIGGLMLVGITLGLGVWKVSSNDSPTIPAEFSFGGVTCSYVQANLQQFATDALEPSEQDSISIHMRRCPVCRKMFDVMNRERASISKMELPHNSDESLPTHRILITTVVD